MTCSGCDSFYIVFSFHSLDWKFLLLYGFHLSYSWLKFFISFDNPQFSIVYIYQQVLETARQVASLPVSSTPIPYDQVKDQCEALVMGKQQKMSVLQSFKLQQEAKALTFPNAREDKSNCLPNGVRILSFFLLFLFLFFYVIFSSPFIQKKLSNLNYKLFLMCFGIGLKIPSTFIMTFSG